MQCRVDMICMKPTLILAASFSLWLGAQCFGQDTTKATFHVTSVRSEKAKDTETRCNNQCFGEKLTVEGYIQPNDRSGQSMYVPTNSFHTAICVSNRRSSCSDPSTPMFSRAPEQANTPRGVGDPSTQLCSTTVSLSRSVRAPFVKGLPSAH